MIDSNDTKRFWDKVARQTSLSDKGFVGMLTDGNEFNAIYRQQQEEDHFLRIFQPNTKMNVLEVGSGGGRWAMFLADKVSSVVGIDFSESMIKIAEQQRLDSGIDNVQFILSDLLAYDADRKFDLVYFSGVLQYLDDDEVAQSIGKAKRMLAADGVIISRDTIQESKRVILAGDYPVIYRTIDEYATLFAGAGFYMDYCELSHKPRRFSHIASWLYQLPFVTYGMAFGVQNVLIGINKLLGEPKILMKKHYRQMLETVGEREHRFFRYYSK